MLKSMAVLQILPSAGLIKTPEAQATGLAPKVIQSYRRVVQRLRRRSLSWWGESPMWCVHPVPGVMRGSSSEPTQTALLTHLSPQRPEKQASPTAQPGAATSIFHACCSHLIHSVGLTEMRPSELADVLWACAWVGHKDKDLLDGAATTLLDAGLS